MAASLGDILTALKNGVVALGDNARFTQALVNLLGIGVSASKVAQAQMTTSYAVIYTCASGQRAGISDIEVCNTTASSIGIYVSVVPSGGTAGAGNAVFFNAALPAYSTMQWTGGIAMAAGDTLQVKGSATGCTITVSGGTA